MANFKTIHRLGCDEIIINKSRFIGYAAPVSNENEAIEFIDEIRKKHNDATHNVYSYVCGNNCDIQRYSDDGEPSGSAGIPALNVIKQEELRNVVVVVTRYFGGIKLGVGGLVRAYTKGAKIGLDNGIIVDKFLFYDVKIDIEYTLLGKIENELVKNDFIIKDKEFAQNVSIIVLCMEENLNKLKSIVMEITSAKCSIEVGDSAYYSIKDGKLL